MNAGGIAELTIETIWTSLASYPKGEYIPSMRTLGQAIKCSPALVSFAYKELTDRGYLTKNGNYFIKAMQGAFVPEEKAQ